MALTKEEKLALIQREDNLKSNKTTEKLIKEISKQKAPKVIVNPVVNVAAPESPEPQETTVSFPVMMKSPDVKLPDGFFDGVEGGLDMVVETLREELTKLDKEPEQQIDYTQHLTAILKRLGVRDFGNIEQLLVEIKEAVMMKPEEVEDESMKEVEKLLKDIKKVISKPVEPVDDKSIFDEVSSKKPLAMMLVDDKGKQITKFGGGQGSTGFSLVGLKNNATPNAQISPATEDTLATIPGLAIPLHDELVLSYTGSNLTEVVYKLSSTTVATLTLAYTGSNLTSVIKS
jgi:hypothetical protein